MAIGVKVIEIGMATNPNAYPARANPKLDSTALHALNAKYEYCSPI